MCGDKLSRTAIEIVRQPGVEAQRERRRIWHSITRRSTCAAEEAQRAGALIEECCAAVDPLLGRERAPVRAAQQKSASRAKLHECTGRGTAIYEFLEFAVDPHFARAVREHRGERRARACARRRESDVEKPIDEGADGARAIDQVTRPQLGPHLALAAVERCAVPR